MLVKAGILRRDKSKLGNLGNVRNFDHLPVFQEELVNQFIVFVQHTGGDAGPIVFQCVNSGQIQRQHVEGHRPADGNQQYNKNDGKQNFDNGRRFDFLSRLLRFFITGCHTLTPILHLDHFFLPEFP